MSAIQFDLTSKSYANRSQLVQDLQRECDRAELGEHIDLEQTSKKLYGLMQAWTKDRNEIRGGAKITDQVRKAHLAHKAKLDRLNDRIKSVSLFPKRNAILGESNSGLYVGLSAAGVALTSLIACKNIFSSARPGEYGRRYDGEGGSTTREPSTNIDPENPDVADPDTNGNDEPKPNVNDDPNVNRNPDQNPNGNTNPTPTPPPAKNRPASPVPRPKSISIPTPTPTQIPTPAPSSPPIPPPTPTPMPKTGRKLSPEEYRELGRTRLKEFNYDPSSIDMSQIRSTVVEELKNSGQDLLSQQTREVYHRCVDMIPSIFGKFTNPLDQAFIASQMRGKICLPFSRSLMKDQFAPKYILPLYEWFAHGTTDKSNFELLVGKYSGSTLEETAHNIKEAAQRPSSAVDWVAKIIEPMEYGVSSLGQFVGNNPVGDTIAQYPFSSPACAIGTFASSLLVNLGRSLWSRSRNPVLSVIKWSPIILGAGYSAPHIAMLALR